MRIVLGILCLVSVGCASNPPVDRERARLHMQIGAGYLNKGQYPQAMTELLVAQKLDPTDPAIANALGLAYYVRGRKVEAESKFRAAIKLSPAYSEAKANLARVLLDGGQTDAAIKILREVEGDLTYPNQDRTLAQLGAAFFAKGQMTQAKDYLARALQINRDNCPANATYGRALQELKEWKRSAIALDQAVEFCRPARFEEPLYYSAMSYFSIGNHEKTRARLEELLKDYPQSKYVAKAQGMLGLLEQ